MVRHCEGGEFSYGKEIIFSFVVGRIYRSRGNDFCSKISRTNDR